MVKNLPAHAGDTGSIPGSGRSPGGGNGNPLLYSFFFLIYFYWRIISLQYCVDFCHISTWIRHKYTYAPSLLNLTPTSAPFCPSRFSQSTSLSSLHNTVNSHYLSVLYTAVYMFPCHSVNLPHPFLSPLCLQVYSLCLHLHDYPVNSFLSTTFLDSIYVY